MFDPFGDEQSDRWANWVLAGLAVGAVAMMLLCAYYR
jgi:hypothetical protein